MACRLGSIPTWTSRRSNAPEIMTGHPLSPLQFSGRLRNFASSSLLVAIAYGLIVFVMWLPYGPHSGMPYETMFAQWSENSSLRSGFYFHGDPLRPHTNTFYQISYLLSFPLGIPGSFSTYGVVYSILWWARGFLAYLILKEFQPAHRVFNLMVGALILTHAADGALQWVGQMNQFGMIFWMLAAFVAGLWFTRCSTRGASIFSLLLVAFLLHMSLWSYEAQLPVLTLLPLSLLALRDRSRARRLVLSGTWYAIEAIYLAQTAVRYFLHKRQGYQQGVLKKDGMTASTFFGDWWFNIREGLHFSKWAEGLPSASSLAPSSAIVWSPLAIWLTVGATIAIFIGLIWVFARQEKRAQADELPTRSRLLILGGWGATLFVFSFPVFLLLDSSRMLWRTQFIASLGYGVLVAVAAGLLASILSERRVRNAAFCSVCIIPMVYGLHASIKRGEFHYGIWERHRFAVAQVLKIAPSVASGTTIILTNVPKEGSPFGDNMWYLAALQLAYPRTHLAGVYFHTDESPSPSCNLKIDGQDWIWTGTGWPPSAPRRFPFEKTLIIEFSPQGEPVLLKTVPQYIPVSAELAAHYQPKNAILLTPPALDYGLRRYLDTRGGASREILRGTDSKPVR